MSNHEILESEMNKTQAINLYTKLANSDHELVTIARYLAEADDKERARYMAQNPKTAAALLAI